MTTPPNAQSVLELPAIASIFLVLTINDGKEAELVDALGDVSSRLKGTDFRAPRDELSCVVGIGADAWDRLYDYPRPVGLHPFKELKGAQHTAPSTPGDLLIHLRSRRMDLCFELAHQLMERFRGMVEVEDEVHGFRYFDERDLLGFVDGAANPRGADAAAAVFVGKEDPAYAGGSYVIVQKYTHDLDAWNAISVEEQERAIGRSKLNDIEQPDDVKATNSHVALNTIVDEEGVEHDIVRDNMPFGRFGSEEFGTYFIGYAADPAITEQMLENMFIGKPPGNHDRILDFSTALTGCLFYVPTAEFLDDPSSLPADPAASDDSSDHDPAEATSSDGSLSIGSLKGDAAQ